MHCSGWGITTDWKHGADEAEMCAERRNGGSRKEEVQTVGEREGKKLMTCSSGNINARRVTERKGARRKGKSHCNLSLYQHNQVMVQGHLGWP